MLLCIFVQRMQKHEPIGIVKKNIGTTISPICYVMWETWNDYATKSWHQNPL